MCGIIGYNGRERAEPILLEGLRRLEYRGYDSAGAAVVASGGFHLRRAVGKLEALSCMLSRSPLPDAAVGIAHTRWATHGGPTAANAHPHLCGRVALVHNGIIENYGELKAELLARGHTFESETDTEVVAHLLDEAYEGNPVEAILSVTARLSGSYALAILFADRDDTLYGVRRSSPLLAGVGEGENFLASDLSAILRHTGRYIPIPEGEVACVGKDTVIFFDRQGASVTHPILSTELSAEDGERGSYAHFMLKEMEEQPEAVRRTLAPYLLSEAELPQGDTVRRILFVACGSAMHACLCGKRFFEVLAGIPCEVHIASELRYGALLHEPGTLAVAVSQSGETADTLAALRRLREAGIPTVGVVNVAASTLAAEADVLLRTHAGPEIAVATTKAYTAQVALLALMACRYGQARGREAPLTPTDFRLLPEKLRAVSQMDGECAVIAARLKEAHDVFFIGRGRDLPVCMEGSLKLKEITYLHSEAYAAGELKHGTISLLHPGVPVLALITDASLRDKTVANMRECRARGGEVILLHGEEIKGIPEDAYDRAVAIPGGLGELSVLPAAAVMQRIAYHTAVLLGRDVDKPRNLAKSVTVE